MWTAAQPSSSFRLLYPSLIHWLSPKIFKACDLLLLATPQQRSPGSPGLSAGQQWEQLAQKQVVQGFKYCPKWSLTTYSPAPPATHLGSRHIPQAVDTPQAPGPSAVRNSSGGSISALQFVPFPPRPESIRYGTNTELPPVTVALALQSLPHKSSHNDPSTTEEQTPSTSSSHMLLLAHKVPVFSCCFSFSILKTHVSLTFKGSPAPAGKCAGFCSGPCRQWQLLGCCVLEFLF